MDGLQEWSLEGDLSDPCLDGNPRIWRHFSQCVRTPQQLVGFVFGCLALVFWFGSHLGLLKRRHTEGATDGRLAPAHHLLHEACADVLNCLGAVLSHQLGTQILFGVYLLCMDALFMVQYLVIKTITECTSRGSISKDHRHEKDVKQRPQRMAVKLHTWPLLLLLTTSAAGLPLVTWHLTDQSEAEHQHFTGRVLLSTNQQNRITGTIRLGYVIGYLSILFHWTSALPTAIKTFQERQMPWSTLLCTLLGIVGNLCYVTSVFCHYTNVGFLVHSLPWTLGRLGMIGIDSALVMLSLIHYCRGLSVRPGQSENERLLGDGSEDESLSSVSDWEEIKDLERNRKLLKLKASSRLAAPSKDHSDTDVSPQRSPTQSRNRLRSKFTSPTLAPPGAEPPSDGSVLMGENEAWKPAWTEEDLQVELTEELTEEQVFAVLAEEDRKREKPESTGAGSESDSLQAARPTLQAAGEGEAGPTLQAAGVPAPPPCTERGEPGPTWTHQHEETFLNLEQEQIVDMQAENVA